VKIFEHTLLITQRAIYACDSTPHTVSARTHSALNDAKLDALAFRVWRETNETRPA
jgi:hypothetical protein